MLAYMSREALERTLSTGRVTFHSRSRGRLWEKGETSGNRLEVLSVRTDCDGDALLVIARARGPACHTGRDTCFAAGDSLAEPAVAPPRLGRTLAVLERVVAARARERPAGSYTARLLDAGPAAAGKKVGEEAVEVALAALEGPELLAAESADLLYHLLVLWKAVGLDPARVAAELAARLPAARDAAG